MVLTDEFTLLPTHMTVNEW